MENNGIVEKIPTNLTLVTTYYMSALLKPDYNIMMMRLSCL